MSKVLFKKIPKNSRLLAIGNFFNREDIESFWRFAGHFKLENQSNWNKSFELEMACLMGIGRTFVQEDNNPFESMRFLRNYVLPDISTWVTRPLGECSRLSKELRNIPEISAQQCFVFECGNTTIWLPKFELARKLFFHSGFMVRAAFSPNGLDNLFAVKRDEENAEAAIQTFARHGVPTRYFRHRDYRHFFAWLLLTPEAKASFESIWQCLSTEQSPTGQYWRWQFNFIPPQFLSGLRVEIRGPYNEQKHEMLVWELAALHELPFEYEGHIQFYHPNIKKPVRGTGEGGGGKPTPPEGDQEVDDEESTDEDKGGEFIELPSEGLSYAKNIPTILKYSGKIPGNFGTKDKETPGGKGGDKPVGTQDPETDGNLPPGDFDQLDKQQDLPEYQNRLSQLNSMLKELAAQEDVTFKGATVAPLPAVKRCKFHMLTETTPRCYLLATFKLSKGATRYILEVDTSDRARSLSTKIFQFKSDTNQTEALDDILAKTVKASLRWPTEVINQYCFNVKSVVHPQSQKHKDETSLQAWRQRLINTLNVTNDC